jgi:hypothetical protein
MMTDYLPGRRRRDLSRTYDRAAQDVGNIVHFEHVNVQIPDQSLATLFYVVGMGFTRDPYLMVGLDNMWVNLGQQQFHLITGEPQRTRGPIGVVVPDLDALVTRLESVRKGLADSQFGFAVEDKHVSIRCPWGNQFRAYAPGPQFGDMTLGIAYVEFPVARGHADGIARFYAEVFSAITHVQNGAGDRAAHVRSGQQQWMIFRETDGEVLPYDGHHVQIYVANFSGPHRLLRERDLITEESSDWQYRFEDIVDLDSGRVLFTLEHEVRSLTHPLAFRPLVNRNPNQRQPTYQRGRDAFVPGM